MRFWALRGIEKILFRRTGGAVRGRLCAQKVISSSRRVTPWTASKTVKLSGASISGDANRVKHRHMSLIVKSYNTNRCTILRMG